MGWLEVEKWVNSSIDTTRSSDSPKHLENRLLSISGLPLAKKSDVQSRFENHPYVRPGMGLKGLNVN